MLIQFDVGRQEDPEWVAGGILELHTGPNGGPAVFRWVYAERPATTGVEPERRYGAPIAEELDCIPRVGNPVDAEALHVLVTEMRAGVVVPCS